MSVFEHCPGSNEKIMRNSFRRAPYCIHDAYSFFPFNLFSFVENEYPLADGTNPAHETLQIVTLTI